MHTELATISTSGTADQKPMVLCQLKSRARPCWPLVNQVTARREARDHARGHQSTTPETTMNRNARLAAPVTAFPVSRRGPLAASQRCQSVTARKNARTPCEPWPTTAPR
jgi:hypothetical protein